MFNPFLFEAFCYVSHKILGAKIMTHLPTTYTLHLDTQLCEELAISVEDEWMDFILYH